VQGWAGIGSTLRVELGENGSTFGSKALGVAEVVTPSGAGAELAPEIRALVVAMAGKGVTASCTEASSNRYGGLRGDSNLPDVRISVGRPDENALTAAVLASAGPAFQAELDRQLAHSGRARLWVPAGRPFDEVWAPNADVRGTRDLPVLLLVGSDASSTEKELAAFIGEVQSEHIVVSQPASLSASVGGSGRRDAGWAAGTTVAVLNRGTPGFAVDTAGSVYVSLLRSCTGWPSGVWIDPPRRTAPDGSNFELEHWDHVYEHALVTGDGDWRATGCTREAQAFNTPLLAVVEPAHPGDLPAAGSFLELKDPSQHVLLAVLKPVENPLAGGRLPGQARSAGRATGPDGSSARPDETVELTARLYESAGRDATATLSGGLSWTIEEAWSANLLEEAGEPIECPDGNLTLSFAPAETRTVRLVLRRAPRAGAAGSASAGSASAGSVAAGPSRAPAGPAPAPATAAVGTAPGLGLGLEPAQPTFSRYWLHNKGSAPMGNQLLAVHLAPTSLRVRKEADASLVATVSSGAVQAEQAGNVEIVVPAGWAAEPPSRLFNVAPGAHASVTFRLTPAAKAKPGRYFVAARVLDAAGQAQEDVATVDLLPVDPLGPYQTGGQGAGGQGGTASQSSFDHPSTQIGAELEALMTRDSLTVAPGTSDVLAVRLANKTSGEIRGEAQLLSPFETWPLTAPWTEGFIVAPGGQTEVPFTVTVPADARALTSWLLVKVMYFGRLWYSPAVPLVVAPGQAVPGVR
ncbi:MAG TPA: NEW3 domain-containing protein, partial [Acidimicrobiales bacterium]|nr:NEW3 domain-containing protein [Acidimicrobiales bacterium]